MDTFDNILVPSGTVNPGYQSNGYTLSGVGVGILTAGGFIKEIAYNKLPPGTSLTGTLRTLSGSDSANPAVTSGDKVFSLRVDTAYNGTRFGVLYGDRSGAIFTANVGGGGGVKQSLTEVGQELVTANIRRLTTLGYL